MKIAKLALLLPVLAFAATLPAQAGDDASFYHRESVTVCVKQKKHCPLAAVGRGVDSFLSWPRILAEGLYGDRVLVNQRGIFATRELPVEERIITPGD